MRSDSIMSVGVVEDEEEVEDPDGDAGAVIVTTELSGYLIVVVVEPSGLVLAEANPPGPKISVTDDGVPAAAVPEGVLGLDVGGVVVAVVEG